MVMEGEHHDDEHGAIRFGSPKRIAMSGNAEAIKQRLAGQTATRFRAAAVAGTAGLGVAVAVYRAMRGQGDESD
jgi:hypothetical protein